MMDRTFRQSRNGPAVRKGRAERGFTLLELVFVVLIGIVMTVIAVPLVNNVVSGYRLRGTVTAVTSSIQGTRYQAIFNGYPFRLVIDHTAMTYQVQNDVNRTGTFANYCVPAAASCPVPVAATSENVTLDADTTFTFSPGGSVQSTTSAGGVTTMVMTYRGKTETITVSSYGSIKVTP
jgi:Tfp pilus assembly protein FimT